MVLKDIQLCPTTFFLARPLGCIPLISHSKPEEIEVRSGIFWPHVLHTLIFLKKPCVV